jgi:hypothetical protein
MEADSGGMFEYGGRIRGQISIWRQIPGQVSRWRQIPGAGFNMEAGLFFTGANFSLARTKPVILCRRSSTRGDLHKSIQLGGSYLCHVFHPAQRKLSSLMLFFMV